MSVSTPLDRRTRAPQYPVNLELREQPVLVVGGEGVVDVDASLLQGSTPVSAESSRNAFPSVRHCPAQNGNFTLKVQAVSGAGDYFFQLFTQSQ